MLYPNRYYKYKVNGKAVKPDISEQIAYIGLNPGINTVEIYYDNMLENIFLCISGVYIVLISGFILFKGIMFVKKGLGKH